MGPRERVLAAIEGQEIWPVPTDVTANLIHTQLEKQLLERLDVPDREGLIRALGAHMRWANPRYIGPPLEKSPVQPPNPWPNEYAHKNIWGAYTGLNTYSDAVVERPLSNAESVGDVERHSWPDPGWFDYTMVQPNIRYDAGWGTSPAGSGLLSVARWAEENPEYARAVGGYQPIFGRICDLCGIEETLIKTATDPDVIHAMVTHITDFMEAWYRGIADAGQGHVDILAYGDDFAGQNGMLISPGKWRAYFKDSWARLFRVAHDHGMKAQFHSCGSIRPVLGDLIDVGMDIFEVVQLRAAGMEPLGLVRDFGSHVTFYGAVDVQDVLPNYTPEAVRAEVRRLIDMFGPGGRFILTSSHLLWPEVPAENVVAMYDEARNYRAP